MVDRLPSAPRRNRKHLDKGKRENNGMCTAPSLYHQRLLFIFEVEDLSVFVNWQVPVPAPLSISTGHRTEQQ